MTTEVEPCSVLLQELLELETTAPNDISSEWVSRVTALGDKISTSLKQGKNFDGSILPAFAKLAKMYPGRTQVEESLFHLLIVHLFHPRLYLDLCKLLRAESSSSESAYCLPTQWPGQAEPDSVPFVSPFDYQSSASHFARCHPEQQIVFTKCVVEFLNIMEPMTQDTNPPWQSFAKMVSFLLRTAAHRDLATMCISHADSFVAVLHRLSVLGPSPSSQKFAKLLLEMLLMRPAIIVGCSANSSFPGANRLLPLYSQGLHTAFDMAAKSPFRFVIDLLNQANDMALSKNPTVLACILISAQRIESLIVRGNYLELYSSCNKISNVQSLLSLLVQFGSLVARYLLRSYGDSTNIATVYSRAKHFSDATLPPMAKANYFFTQKKAITTNNSLLLLSQLDRFSDLHRSLLCIGKALVGVLRMEIEQILEYTHDQRILSHILTYNIEHICCFVLSVAKCSSYSGKASIISELAEACMLDIVSSVFAALEQQRTLVWITIFNFAHEICYHDTALISLVQEILEKIVLRCNEESYNDLVSSGVGSFLRAFGDDALAQTTELPRNTKVLDKDEYMFLYDSEARRKPSSHFRLPVVSGESFRREDTRRSGLR